MKKKLKTKYLCAVTALLMIIVPFAVSCGSGTDTPAQTTADTADNETETAAETSPIPDVVFDGDEVRFMTVENIDRPNYTTRSVYAESYNGDLINDCVFDRNLEIEQTLNVKIKEDKLPDTEKAAYQSIMSGDETYDVVTPYINYSFPNAVEGLYMNLLDVPHLNLEAGWWDQRANDNLLIGNQLYFTTGDICLLDNDCTQVLFFNKQIRDELELSDPYTLVKDGKWTIDAMFEDCFEVTQDLNGDGSFILDDDKFGFFCHSNATVSLFFSAGARMIEKDENGELVITMDSERAAAALEKMLTYCIDPKNLANAATRVVKPIFLESNIYIAAWSLADINGLRDSEFDFGILPYPKYDEAQDGYYCLISTGYVPGYSIPTTNSNPGLAGAVLETMAYLSSGKLTETYYDITLTQKYFRDNESAEMLDIIFSSRVYDIGFVTGIGKLSSVPTKLYGARTTAFASAVAERLPAAQAELEELVELFKSKNN